MSSRIFFLVYFLISYLTYCISEKCSKSDLEFQYTECDKTGHRWLVSVPKTNKSCDAGWDFSIPKPARNCGEPCSPGTFLDVETQECKDCPSGTYSQGDTIEIDNWQTLPQGFHSFSFHSSGRPCNGENWTPNKDYISASVSQCQSILSYTVTLYKPGELRFNYQLSEEGTLFMVNVRQDECLSKVNDKNGLNTVNFMDSTTAKAWTSKTVPLKQGRNVIIWTVIGIESERRTVKISKLRITNSLFSTQCTNCSAGYFSSLKSSICSPCPMNKYNDQPSSDHCKDCPAEYYSLPGSKSCQQKQICTTSDYSYRWTKCNKQKQRQKVYLWIEPKLCSDTKAGAAQLPIASSNVDCEPCPRGTFLNESLQQCQFCPSLSMALNAGDPCTKCSANTKPVSSIWYDKWSHPLPNLTFLCIEGLSSERCSIDDSWLFNGDHLQSSLLSDVNVLKLDFQTNEENYASKTLSKSTISFQFSMNCSGDCVLYFLLKRKNSRTIRVNTWVNTTVKTESQHHLPPNTSGNYIWLFSHSTFTDSSPKSTDFLKIYSIKMSNLKDVGAIDCRNCDPNSLNNGCLDCDKGKYFSKDSHRCESCPKDHILKNYPGQSINDCVKCDSGLGSSDGSNCVPNVNFISKWNNFYDLSNLKGHHLLRGNRLFNIRGQEYLHVFNVTLFGEHSQPLSICRNNISLDINYVDDILHMDEVVEARSPMCRVTIIADKSQNNTLYSMLTTSLAERFSKFEQSNVSSVYWNEMNDSLVRHGFDGDSTGVDVHVHLASDRKTEICTSGRKTIITIRCDKKLLGAQFLLPTKCAVETCDGCNFHFLLKSRDACPYCRPEDFTVITEECVGGHQKRHFQAPSYCNLQPGSLSTESIKCPIVTMRTAIIVIPTVAVLVFLVSLVIYCHKKNKSLEYKYMRLVGGNEDNENILTGAESCAMNDGDEDEDDDVKIKTNSKSGKIFARFNKPNRNRKDENDMETVNLNDNPEFDI